MAATRKTPGKTSRATTRAKRKSLKQRRVKTVDYPHSTGHPSEQSRFVIVGIGASAGGLEALEEFFRQMPSNTGMAFVVVSHQHAGHVSLLPSLLAKCTTMSVMEASDGLRIEANCVYLAPGGVNLAILHGVLHFMEPIPQERVPLPIDYFFRSLAEDQKQRAVGIIFSGTGTDGTVGLRAIKGEFGMTIVQDPASAKYQGMPRSAIAAGVVDIVLRADQMSEPLRSYARTLAKPQQSSSDIDDIQTLRKIFILLRDRTGIDFALYKENTIRRRIERRMNLHQIENMKQYLRFVLGNPHELDALFQELLIGVTSFFRDPLAFKVLEQKGLPALLENKPEGAALRVWVAGCSTGEEAYSLAILIREYLTQRKLRVTVQIFASDVDHRAIEQARVGLYPIGIASDITSERLQRYFTKEDGSYRVKKEIRNMVVFATHNILTDSPFTKLDLLSCRNLLIYLEAKAQQKILPLFHYALKPNGILFLGSSETIGGFENLFTVIDRKQKLFKRSAEPGKFAHLAQIPVGLMQVPTDRKTDFDAQQITARAPSVPELVQQLLVTRYAPAAVVVNDRSEVIYIHGHTGHYLELAPGQPTHNLIEMAREGLQHDLVLALHQAASRKTTIARRGLHVQANGKAILVDLTVKHINEPERLEGLFLVTFEMPLMNKTAGGKKASASAADSKKKTDSGLMRELKFAKQRLQHSIEELQTSNEELKSSNEELQSTNEELQSTNEELETAKEELQSLNEELVTVNSELQTKVDQLAEANDDLQNLMNSTEVGTIFLDNDLRIKRFTLEAKRVSNLIAVDVGRPLSDIVSKLTSDRLVEDAQEVLQTLKAKEREVQTADGSWFFMRILPYRTAKNVIDGLVLAFLDITKIKEAELAVKAARGMAASIVDTVREPLVVLDDHLHIISANQSFYRTFQITPGEVESQLLYHLCNGAWNIPDLRRLLETVLPKSTSFQDFIMDKTFPHIGRKVFTLNGRRLEQESSQPGRILLAMEETKPEQKEKSD